MLGESHSLTNDFPEYKAIINQLNQNDEDFAKNSRRYNDLDKEIRELELNGTPIDDDAMHLLKQQRADLKDTLYQCLVDAKV